MNRFAVIILVSLSAILLSSSSTASRFGTVEEVIQAAKENKEPAYIKDLLETLPAGLTQWVASKSIASPEEMLCFLLTMRSYNSLSWTTAENPAVTIADDVAGSAASDAAYNAAEASFLNNATWNSGWDDPSWNPSWQPAVDSAKDFWSPAMNEARAAVRGALMGITDPQEAGRVAYRVAEWVSLNACRDHMNDVITVMFVTTDKLLPGSATNPLVNETLWSEFRTKYSDTLRPEAKGYVIPWFSILDSLVSIKSKRGQF